MSSAERWLLPDGMSEVLPPQARQIENLRRQLLDLFHSWGYDLVLPPKVEFLESLLVGAGQDLGLQTFKLIDQISGRSMGVSADVTPQVARMDAHSMPSEGPARFCYSSQVVRTQLDNLLGSRSPMQIGAELFGVNGLDSDLEIISLMLDSLLLAGATNLCLDLGHVGIYRALLQEAALPEAIEEQLFKILQQKRLTELKELLEPWQAQAGVQLIQQLASLNGDAAILTKARQILASAPQSVLNALHELDELVKALSAQYPQVNIYLDLSELRGFHYHTGVVFAAYVPSLGQALAKGGRYDEIGKAFGRARPATGFSTDLKMLAKLTTKVAVNNPVAAPAAMLHCVAGRKHLAQQRALGQRVILFTQEENIPSAAEQKFVFQADQWQLVSI